MASGGQEEENFEYIPDKDNSKKFKDLNIPKFGETISLDWLVGKWGMLLEMLPALYNVKLSNIYHFSTTLSLLSKLPESTNVEPIDCNYIRLHALLIDKNELRTNLVDDTNLSKAFQNLQNYWKNAKQHADILKKELTSNSNEKYFKACVVHHIFDVFDLPIDSQDEKIVCQCGNRETLDMKQQVAVGSEYTWNTCFELLVNTEVQIAFAPQRLDDGNLLKEELGIDSVNKFKLPTGKMESEIQALLGNILLAFAGYSNRLMISDKLTFSPTVLIDKESAMLMLYDCVNDIILFGDYFRYQLKKGNDDEFIGHLEVLVLFLWIICHFSLFVKSKDKAKDIMNGFKEAGFKKEMEKENMLQHYQALSLRE